jgi:1-deoxy-D-xylulose-5-phosphate reductoisomerase
MKKKIVILGSTGSIGKIFLNILKKDIANNEIFLLTANKNINELLKQLKIFKVKNIIINDKKKIFVNKK